MLGSGTWSQLQGGQHGQETAHTGAKIFYTLPEAVALVEQWETAVQYRSTPQRLRRASPGTRDDQTFALVPQDASASGAADGSGYNIRASCRSTLRPTWRLDRRRNMAGLD